jgi:hypothetical protein
MALGAARAGCIEPGSRDRRTSSASTIRALCAWLGIGFDPATLTPYNGARMIDGGDHPNFPVRRVLRPLRAETPCLAQRLGYPIDGEAA